MPTTFPPETADHAARRALAEVVRGLDAPRERVRRQAEALVGLRATRLADLAPLAALAQETLTALPAGVDGTGVVLAPGLLADAPLALEWWRRGPDGRPERLEVTFDPEDPAEFHYPDAEWFAVPRDRGIAWIAGPFVDSGGTNRHLCTYSVPIHDGAGGFLGIAGADLRVGHVERVARRALAGVQAPAALVNRELRVIASNEPGLDAATLLEGSPDAVVWDAGVPWGVALL